MKKNIIMFCAAVMTFGMVITSYAGQWKQDTDGWKYQNDDGNYYNNGWRQIKNSWYYFDDNGYILSDTVTPDGYGVNESGEWDERKIGGAELNIPDNSYEIKSLGDWVGKGIIPEGDYIFYPEDKDNRPIVEGTRSRASISNYNYIRLYDGDMVRPGIYIPVDSATADAMDLSKAGVFLVGKDIKAGTYSLFRGERRTDTVDIALCLVFNNIPSSRDNTAPEKNISSEIYVQASSGDSVTVKDGQYLQLINCTANLVRPE